MMPAKRVSEAAPVQVYLDRGSRDRLDQLAANLELTKSDVLRRGLIALEQELLDPSAHPALRLLGSIDAEAAPGVRPGVRYDVAREHDRFLATVHEREPAPARPAAKQTTRRRGR